MTLKVAEIAGVVSALSFTLTVIFLFGFSVTANVNLFLFFGLNDYLRLAVEWIPPIVVGWLVGFLFVEYLQRVEDGLMDEDLPSTASVHHLRTVRDSADRAAPAAMVVVAVILTAIALLRDWPRSITYAIWAVGAPFVWLAFLNWYARVPAVADRLRKRFPNWHVVMAVIPMVGIAAGFYGMYAGDTGRRLYLPTADATIQLEGQTTPACRRILFVLTDYVITRETTGTVAVHPASSVRSIRFGQACNGA